MDYKQRLTDRFISILDDFAVLDRDISLKMKTTDMEDLGILLADAQKKLNRILEQNPLLFDEYQKKKLEFLQKRRNQIGKDLKN